MPITKDRLSFFCLVGRAKLRSCHHALDWLPLPVVMRVVRGVECGSHAAAAAVPTIRCVSYR
ncbi:MAG TPA: hypothetical protein DEF43_02385 [Chloroflexus aurantiacus]|nr:MAG: hypothetical protein D6716_10845 [Chloroflexota bacterium]HBW66014.1 hypothetical protein [Chloroflexus aurantiacus]